MKYLLFALILIVLTQAAIAEEQSYRDNVDTAQRRYLELENRLQFGHSLTPAEEVERYTALGRLIIDNPVWALTRDVTLDYQALRSGKPRTAEVTATAEKLLQLLQITSSLEHRATTLPEANAFASILREFVARRDVDGARAWAKVQ